MRVGRIKVICKDTDDFLFDSFTLPYIHQETLIGHFENTNTKHGTNGVIVSVTPCMPPLKINIQKY